MKPKFEFIFKILFYIYPLLSELKRLNIVKRLSFAGTSGVNDGAVILMNVFSSTDGIYGSFTCFTLAKVLFLLVKSPFSRPTPVCDQ